MDFESGDINCIVAEVLTFFRREFGGLVLGRTPLRRLALFLGRGEDFSYSYPYEHQDSRGNLLRGFEVIFEEDGLTCSVFVFRESRSKHEELSEKLTAAIRKVLQ